MTNSHTRCFERLENSKYIYNIYDTIVSFNLKIYKDIHVSRIDMNVATTLYTILSYFKHDMKIDQFTSKNCYITVHQIRKINKSLKNGQRYYNNV